MPFVVGSLGAEPELLHTHTLSLSLSLMDEPLTKMEAKTIKYLEL